MFSIFFVHDGRMAQFVEPWHLSSQQTTRKVYPAQNLSRENQRKVGKRQERGNLANFVKFVSGNGVVANREKQERRSANTLHSCSICKCTMIKRQKQKMAKGNFVNQLLYRLYKVIPTLYPNSLLNHAVASRWFIFGQEIISKCYDCVCSSEKIKLFKLAKQKLRSDGQAMIYGQKYRTKTTALDVICISLLLPRSSLNGDDCRKTDFPSYLLIQLLVNA